MNLRKVPLKNYVILSLIVAFTILLSTYMLKIYTSKKAINHSIMMDVLAQVTIDDLDNFLTERDTTILYMCLSNDNKCNNFEKKFKSYVTKNYLTDNIFYFDISKYKDDVYFLSDFYNKYKSADLLKKIGNYPVILVFKEGKIIDVLSSNKDSITVNDVSEFLEEYEYFR